jgi:hypothetical protein
VSGYVSKLVDEWVCGGRSDRWRGGKRKKIQEKEIAWIKQKIRWRGGGGERRKLEVRKSHGRK